MPHTSALRAWHGKPRLQALYLALVWVDDESDSIRESTLSPLAYFVVAIYTGQVQLSLRMTIHKKLLPMWDLTGIVASQSVHVFE